MLTALKSKNPAVEKLFASVLNPLAAQALEQALRYAPPLTTESLTDELLPPAFILANVARDFNTVLVDDYGLLRTRLEALQEYADLPRLCEELLAGAGFNATPRRYPEAAHLNCAADEVRMEFLPVGTAFYLNTGNGKTKRGVLVSKTASRALVEWDGRPQERSFTDHRSGEEVTITASGRTRTGCALDCGVVPIHRTISPEDHEWAVNAYKELTGAFDDKPAVVSKRKR